MVARSVQPVKASFVIVAPAFVSFLVAFASVMFVSVSVTMIVTQTYNKSFQKSSVSAIYFQIIRNRLFLNPLKFAGMPLVLLFYGVPDEIGPRVGLSLPLNVSDITEHAGALRMLNRCANLYAVQELPRPSHFYFSHAVAKDY